MNIQITFDGAVASIRGLNIDAVEALRYKLGVYLDEEQYEAYSEKTKLPLTQGELYCHLTQGDELELKIPTGLLMFVTRWLKSLNLTFTLTKQVGKADLSDNPWNERMRPDQKEFVEVALKQKRVIIKAVTSYGKSWALSEFLNRFTEDTPRLVLVPAQNLLYQMQQDIADYLKVELDSIGLVGDGKYNIKPITVAIPDTLASRVSSGHQETIDYLATVTVLVADETHRYANCTGQIVSDALTSTEYRLGCSATPSVDNPLLLEGMIGPLSLREFSPVEMMAKGVIMTPDIQFHEAPPAMAPDRLLKMNFSKADWKDPKVMWAYNQLYDFLIVNNAGRNLLAARLAYEFIQKEQGPILILVKKVGTTKDSAVSHADIMHDLLLEQFGIDLPVIHGKTKKKSQDAVKQQLENYEISGAIASTGILSEGISIKSIAGLINLAGGSGGPDQREIVQRIGRALRKKEGKADPIVWDFIDPVIRTQEIFHNQSKKRMKCCVEEYPNCVQIIKTKKAA